MPHLKSVLRSLEDIDERVKDKRFVRGSHGLAATDMPGLLSMVAAGKLLPEKLVQRDADGRCRGNSFAEAR